MGITTTGLRFISVLLLCLAIAAPASAAFVQVKDAGAAWHSSAPSRPLENGVALTVNKQANLLLNRPGISRLTFAYKAEGYFTLTYLTYLEGKPPQQYLPYLRRKQLPKGSGKITIDLRHTENWSPSARPLLLLAGNGILTITDLATEKPSTGRGYLNQKDHAFFMMPEVSSHFLANSITPVFWSYTNNTFFLPLVAAATGLAGVGLLLYGRWRPLPGRGRWLIAIGLAGHLVFTLHFLYRYAPNMNLNVVASTEEKLLTNSPNPELAQLAVNLQPITARGQDVIVQGAGWFSAEFLCYYAWPARCGWDPGEDGFSGRSLPYAINPEEADLWITFNPPKDVAPPGEVLYALNPNVKVIRTP